MVKRLHPVGIMALKCDNSNHNVQDTHTHTNTNPAVRLCMLENVHRTQSINFPRPRSRVDLWPWWSYGWSCGKGRTHGTHCDSPMNVNKHLHIACIQLGFQYLIVLRDVGDEGPKSVWATSTLIHCPVQRSFDALSYKNIAHVHVMCMLLLQLAYSCQPTGQTRVCPHSSWLLGRGS